MTCDLTPCRVSAAQWRTSHPGWGQGVCTVTANQCGVCPLRLKSPQVEQRSSFSFIQKKKGREEKREGGREGTREG